jgi:type III restriction enzyme
MPSLHETIKSTAFELRIPFPEIPKYISDNLRYEFYDWQKQAFENLIIFDAIKEKENNTKPTHLMFNMATGTGKTLLMASCILYYYKQGYRKFIFFVNQNNIVDKTENNFINRTHSKYLFVDKVVINDKTVNIEKVETFSNNNDFIEIKFTTIQKLYNDIHIERENQVYLDDLIKQDIVMLADEGHHLNANTKKNEQEELDLSTELTDKTGADEIERKGWEHTVIQLLLNKNNNTKKNRNVLLEFTATIPEIQTVMDKYADKIIYKFGLKEFLSAGYTKEINLLYSKLNKKERILQALLFSWYRHKIALRNKVPNFKPVILFRSKYADVNLPENSFTDYNEFLNIIKKLSEEDFAFLSEIETNFSEGEKAYEQGKSRVLDLIKFIKNENIKWIEIINFIKDNFTERNCIITNSKTNKTKQEKTDEDQERLLNSLEDKNNHIRAIFTVNRLTEGWDVLNLFDIVRLYTGRDESKDKKGNRKAGSATVSEIQLIGRGVRYYPFDYKEEQKNKRKFDNQLNNEMRALEELYYHSDSDHKYIDELKRELKKKGFIDDKKIEKRFNLKKDFANSDFYKNVRIWKNEKVENPERKQKTLNYLKNNLDLKFSLASFEIREEEIDFDSEYNDKDRLNINAQSKKTITIKIKDFEKHIFQKAINIKAKSDKSLLRFEMLKEELQIDSMEDFRKKIIGDFEIGITTTKEKIDDISNKEKLDVLMKFFDILIAELKQNINPYKGNDFGDYKLEEFFGEEKKKSVEKDEESEEIEGELGNQDWYVLDHFSGTSEEKGLIKFIQETIVNLKEKYKEVYLLRNEEQYKIYDFNTGKGFQPDFILFLKDESVLYYQIFIEPKGDNILAADKWKNDFLKEITEKYSDNKILEIENKNYNLIGLPLFNKKEIKEFKDAYKKLIN